MSQPLSIVYFGTAAFAVPALQALLAAPEQFRVLAVVTQPDRPAGRKGELRRSPVADVASAYELPLLQFESLKDPNSHAVLARLAADFYIVAAYGLIIPQAVLDMPRLGCVNLHGSILPSYRGASPIQEAIKNGDQETGVTLMRMDVQVDHGGMYAVARVPIASTDTYTSLESKLALAAAPMLVESLPQIAKGALQAREQNHDAATFTKLISKDDGRLDFRVLSAVAAERLLRAYTPWPGVHMLISRRGAETRLKVLGMSAHADDAGSLALQPGTLFLVDGAPAVKATDGYVVLAQVQPEGGKPMVGKAFVQGNRDLFVQS